MVPMLCFGPFAPCTFISAACRCTYGDVIVSLYGRGTHMFALAPAHSLPGGCMALLGAFSGSLAAVFYDQGEEASSMYAFLFVFQLRWLSRLLKEDGPVEKFTRMCL